MREEVDDHGEAGRFIEKGRNYRKKGQCETLADHTHLAVQLSAP